MRRTMTPHPMVFTWGTHWGEGGNRIGVDSIGGVALEQAAYNKGVSKTISMLFVEYPYHSVNTKKSPTLHKKTATIKQITKSQPTPIAAISIQPSSSFGGHHDNAHIGLFPGGGGFGIGAVIDL